MDSLVFLAPNTEEPFTTSEVIAECAGVQHHNCRWVDQKTQSNNRRKQKWIEIDGIVKTLSEWADISGVSYSTIQYRLGKGWDAKKAIFQPSKKENGK